MSNQQIIEALTAKYEKAVEAQRNAPSERYARECGKSIAILLTLIRGVENNDRTCIGIAKAAYV